MKKRIKKITLTKETLHQLTAREAEDVLGGNTSTRTSDFRACGPPTATVCPPGSLC